MSSIMETWRLCLLFLLVVLSLFDYVKADEDAAEPPDQAQVQTAEEKIEYAKGSLCGYCDYCKFCKLCDADCPCDPTPSKPNCKMCKYCKYCYLCSAACDTFCKAGGIVDKVSAAVINALPFDRKDEIDQDINSVQHWIERKRDEL